MKKDEEKFRKRKDGSQKNHKTFPRWIQAILFFCGFCLYQTSFGQDITEIKAIAEGTINCTNTMVTLRCNTSIKGLLYRWTGPSGYTSTSQKPGTSLPGNYMVSVTDPSTGNTTTASVIVIMDTISPKGLKVVTSGMLTCKDTQITLTGSSTTPGVRYEWQGPDGFTSSEKMFLTATPGNYQLTVINPVNGCISKSNIAVFQNVKPPEDVSAIASGVITCKNKSVKLKGVSSTPGVSYAWTGPGFSGELDIHEVSIPGDYQLEVTNPVNGCISIAHASIQQDKRTPQKLMAKALDTLTCKVHNVSLVASSAMESTIYEWSGPKNISSSENSISTNEPGDYTLIATNPENGCSINKKITVVQDTAPPADVKAMSTGKLTCKVDAVVISCISATKNVTFDWNGPNGFTSQSASPKVMQKGTYTIEVTKMSNGCSVTNSINVDKDISPPKEVTANSSGTISCENPKVKLMGKSLTENVTFIWSGPNDFQSDVKEPEISQPGKYSLTVLDPINGCKEETNVIVSGEVCVND
jgi:hypothetical protein